MLSLRKEHINGSDQSYSIYLGLRLEIERHIGWRCGLGLSAGEGLREWPCTSL